MQKNIGQIDATIRIILGVLIIAIGLANSSIFGVIGIIPIFTALVKWCPLYTILKIDTRCSKDGCEK